MTNAPTTPSPIPDRPSLDCLEDKWAQVWREERTYAFGGTADRSKVFSIDTPPPTASGSLHMGHVFSYTHTDCMARYKRMAGFDVFSRRAIMQLLPLAAAPPAELPAPLPKAPQPPSPRDHAWRGRRVRRECSPLLPRTPGAHGSRVQRRA